LKALDPSFRWGDGGFAGVEVSPRWRRAASTAARATIARPFSLPARGAGICG